MSSTKVYEGIGARLLFECPTSQTDIKLNLAGLVSGAHGCCFVDRHKQRQRRRCRIKFFVGKPLSVWKVMATCWLDELKAYAKPRYEARHRTDKPTGETA